MRNLMVGQVQFYMEYPHIDDHMKQQIPPQETCGRCPSRGRGGTVTVSHLLCSTLVLFAGHGIFQSGFAKAQLRAQGDQLGLEDKVWVWGREGATGRDVSEFESKSQSQPIRGLSGLRASERSGRGQA